MSVYAIGVTDDTITDLAELGALEEPLPYPKSEFGEYAAYRDLASGEVRGFGLPTAAWHFGYLEPEQYNALAAYRSGPTSIVYIRTRRNDDSWGDYRAVMIWPQNEPLRTNTLKTDFVVRFRMLEAVEDISS